MTEVDKQLESKINLDFSINNTLNPNSAAFLAAAGPAHPAPTTIQSYSFLLILKTTLT